MKMRILYVGLVGESLPPPYSGIPKRALIFGRLWRELGNSVGFAFTYKNPNGDDLGAQGTYYFEFSHKPNLISKLLFLLKWVIANPALYWHLVRLGYKAHKEIRRDVILYAAYGVFVDRIYADFRPDVIVGETALIKSFYALLAAKRRNIPFVLETYAEVHDESMTHFRSREIRDAFWKYFLSMADIVIAASDFCACGPLKYLPKEKVHMVYATTLDVKRYSLFTGTKRDARKYFNLPQDEFFAVAVGAFTHRKGHDHIIAAVAELKRRGIRIGVLLCGADDPQWLRDIAKEHGIEDQVHFFQRLSEDDLRLLYRAADVYCDASNSPRACLGVALTEGMASHLPAVVYDAGGLPEVVEDGKSGFHAPLNNISELATALHRVQTLSSEEYAAFGQRALERTEKLFDVSTISKQLLGELEEVIKKI